MASKELRVVILGPKGVGKSRLANTLLGLTVDSEEHFIECGEGSGRLAFSCQYLSRTTDGVNFHVVDTPGIVAGNAESSRNWQNMVHAFDMVGRTVDSFVLVLDANDPESGEAVCRFLLKMFGEIAAINAVVVFLKSKYSGTRNSGRISRVVHRYLRDMLVEGYPMIDIRGPTTTSERAKLLEMLKTTADGRRYTIGDFKVPQFKFSGEWVRDVGKLSEDQIVRAKCIGAGVPDILFDRYPEEELLTDIERSLSLEVPHAEHSLHLIE